MQLLNSKQLSEPQPQSWARLDRRLTALLAIVWTLAFLAPHAEAVTWRDDGAEQNYRDMANNTGGFSASTVWPDLIPQGWVWDFAGPGLRGSATLIAPNWVLTAGHVLKLNSAANYTLDNMWFYLGGDTGNNYAGSRVLEAHVFPAWEQNFNYFEGIDIALLRIEDPLGSTYGHATVSSSTPALGTRLVGGGYGIGGTGSAGATSGLGIKRAMENTVDRNPNNLSVQNSQAVGGLLLMDFDSPIDATNATNTLNATSGPPVGAGSSSPTPLTYEGSLSGGDSGGSMFYYGGGNWQLAGVNSFISSIGPGGKNAGYGTITGLVNIANHYDWIQGIVAVPEPSALLYLLAAMMTFLIFRRARGRPQRNDHR